LLALVILLVLAGTFWAAVIRPLADYWNDHQEALARSTRLLAGYLRSAAMRGALEAQLQQLTQEGASPKGFVDGATTTLAAAKLQGEIKQIIENNHAEIRSTQNLPSSTTNGFEKVEIRYDIAVSMSALEPLLHQLETHAPYLFIDHVDIQAPDSLSGAAPGTSDPKLTVRWDIRGYRRAGAP
jgi:hypothetical protein